ncbi:ribonuclease III, partial [Sistotremastrum suecicum HHB10207 ss-3]
MVRTTTLPELPPIRNIEIEDAVFTHRSLNGVPNSARAYLAGEIDNERLSFLGSSVLEFLIGLLVHDGNPSDRKGPLTDKRASLLHHLQLAQWAVEYGLHSRVRASPSSILAVQNSTKMQAQVFQAYVGGLFKDIGLKGVVQWLQALMR